MIVVTAAGETLKSVVAVIVCWFLPLVANSAWDADLATAAESRFGAVIVNRARTTDEVVDFSLLIGVT